MTAPAQTPAADVMVSFADPSAIGGTEPRPRDWAGHVVVIRPTRIEYDVPGVEDGKKQDRVTADILIVDGPIIEFGGNPVRGKPNTHRVNAPYLAKDVYISNTNLVKAVKDHVGTAVVVGRIQVGKANNPAHNPPINLIQLDPADPARALAGAVYQQVLRKTFVNSEPVAIGAAVAQPAASAAPVVDPEYAAFLAAKQAAAAPPAPIVDPEYAAFLAAKQTATAPPAPVVASTPAPAAVDPAAAFAQWQAEQAAKLPQPAASDPTIAARPDNWAPEVWASLQQSQRQQVLDSVPPFK